MSIQVAVRLPEHLVAFLDERVAGGEASRAAVVTKALMKYQRQLSAEHDAEIYLSTSEDPDLLALAEWNARQPRPWLD
ncbi:antitoxin [Nocardioides marmoriginsengisoli]|uniref:Antitoxin n=1 Tax=Nocardioides marmoriginsengisoli TaxID=661483 RepID=A0A3N0CEW8_9ACTN|nr:antitoxin [Nocardioides marmoriginsengisoli]RNL61978.1 antitoxin [Nocardioides marmoriginsengisoli]